MFEQCHHISDICACDCDWRWETPWKPSPKGAEVGGGVAYDTQAAHNNKPSGDAVLLFAPLRSEATNQASVVPEISAVAGYEEMLYSGAEEYPHRCSLHTQTCI